MVAGRLMQRLTATSPAVQATVTGAYAWGVTVAPSAWSRGAPTVAKAVAILALATLGAFFAEARFGERARRAGLWGFVFAAAVVWSAAPGSLAPLRLDAVRGLTGMLGWALFGLTVAGPGRSTEGHSGSPRPMPPRQVLPRGDGLFLAVAVVLAIGIQVVGWRVASVERALLVRLVVVAAALGLVTTSAEVALARHKRTSEASFRVRVRRATPALVAVLVLTLVGALMAVRRLAGW